MSKKRGTFGPIQECRKLSFREEISKRTIVVEFNEVGWIHVEQFAGNGGLFGHTPKFSRLDLTIEDARNLVKCLNELLPEQETEKFCPVNNP